MKQLQQSEYRSPEFEGATPDEAVRLARAALGEDAPVRCWKTRRGGVMGFFARESFVASLEPPAGALKRVKAAAPTTAEPSPRGRAPREAWDHESDEHSGDSRAGDTDPHDNFVVELVESMNDEVDLRFSEEALREFSSVLAQAEAALKGTDDLDEERRTSSESPPDPEPAATIELSVDPSGDDVPSTRTLVPEVETPRQCGPEVIAGLRGRLAALGVPEAFLPRDEDATLDALVRALATLPVPAAVPDLVGPLVVVAGDLENASTSAQLVARTLGLEPSALVVGELTRIGRLELRRRRDAGTATIVVVEVPLRGDRLADALGWISTLHPDYVLGALSAAEKRSDVRRWCERFSRLDGLSLSRCDETTTPAELMGEVPISYVDGTAMTTLQWVQVLLRWLEGVRR